MQTDNLSPFVNLLWLTSAELVTYVERKVRPLGLTIHDLRAIAILGERGPMSPSDLATALAVTNGAVTGVVARLSKAEVVTQSNPSKTDKRRKLITVRYSDLDDVLMDLVVTVRQLFNSYSKQELSIIQRHHSDLLQILKQSKGGVG